jgi:hypothetical protein
MMADLRHFSPIVKGFHIEKMELLRIRFLKPDKFNRRWPFSVST